MTIGNSPQEAAEALSGGALPKIIPAAFLGPLKSIIPPLSDAGGPCASQGDGAATRGTPIEPAGSEDIGAEPRALRMFEYLPIGYVAFAVPDRSCEPMILPGEVAVVDLSDRLPKPGALYLRRLISSGHHRAEMTIVEVQAFARRWYDDAGAPASFPSFLMVKPNRPRSREEWKSWSAQFGPAPLADGPYDPPSALSALPWNSLVGRVVGILIDPDAERPAS